VSESAVLLHS